MELYCQNKIKIAIVGGGPAGIYCALHIANNFLKSEFKNYSITIFDKAQILRTILPTGNGRCNITNSIYDINEFVLNYPRGQKFLYSLFSRHFNYDSVEFFNSIGVKTYQQDDFRIFPESNSAKDVKDKMLSCLNKFKNVKVFNKEIKSKNDLINFDKIVLSAGSRKTEALIKSFGLSYVPFEKALCELKIEDNFYPQGVSIKSLDGDFIFTKDGVSGPLIFKISSIKAFDPIPFEITIKLFDENKLIELVRKNPTKAIGNLVCTFLPRSFVKVHVDLFDKNACEISREKLISYSYLKLKIIAKSNAGEIVNAGGIELYELDKNCKSKKHNNLWCCGEILNIDGFCGGFNLQNCWSSAFAVANDIVSSIIKE